MSQGLPARDLDLIATLTSRVRMLAISQLKVLYQVCEGSHRNLTRRLNRLSARGLLELHVINAHVLTPSQPLFAWSPGSADPDAQAISHRARSRWSFAATPILVCVASPRAANLLASSAFGIPKREHYDHDLLLGAAYLHYRTRRPKAATLWVGEYVLAKAGYRIKDPDAFLRDPQGKHIRAIESSGRYSPQQVESFHDHCVEHELPYELW